MESTVIFATNGLNVTTEGGDFGGTTDQGNLSYQIYSGNFDVCVRVADLGLSDIFAKAGLMARETLTNDGRFAASFATPAMNGTFFEWRDPAGSTASKAGDFRNCFEPDGERVTPCCSRRNPPEPWDRRDERRPVIDQDTQLWRDPSRTAAERVADLLGRMTLEEKAAQLTSIWLGRQARDGNVAPMQGDFRASEAPFAELIRAGLGQLTRVFGTRPVPPADAARTLREVQAQVVAASRFGIPAVAHEECLTGFAAWTATIFPTPLAWGASFDPELVCQMAAAIGASMRAVGIHQGLSPVLHVTRDPPAATGVRPFRPGCPSSYSGHTKSMAHREIVTLRFIKPPTAAQAALITRRIHEEDVPAGAAGSDHRLRGSRFSRVRVLRMGIPAWNRLLALTQLEDRQVQALLHVLGFPNDACSYPAWAIEEEDFIALLHPSSPTAFSQEEVQMMQLLFPEFELNLKKF